MARVGTPTANASRGGLLSTGRGCVLVPTDDAADAGRLRALGPYNLVGRAPECQLRFDNKHISTTHSCIRWTGEAWRLQDLGSTNGTFCNGRRLRRAEQVTLNVGDCVAFGGRSTYRVSSVEQPAAAAVPLHGGAPRYEQNGMIALPSAAHPEVTLLSTDGGWVIESAEGRAPLSDGQTVSTSNGAWRFTCPRVTHPTEPVTTGAVARDLASLQLVFRVSGDEEHVDLVVATTDEERTFPSRVCFYFLLTLARLRLRDQEANVAQSAAGWASMADLQKMLAAGEQQLNLDIYRLRKFFAQLGIVDAVDIIERRSRPGKLRIGVTRLSVERG